MALFTKVGIVGTGLIGGSLGLALKRTKIAASVVGTSRHAASIRIAMKKGAIDSGSRSLDILSGCDLVILATPVETILKQTPALKRYVSDDCIVIDVASTKYLVVREAHRAFSRFVGCHPLAGSEKRGIAFAKADLFDGQTCIITPLKNTDGAALAAVRALWKRIGANVRMLDPAAHDRALAYISHLPHVAAFALMASVPQKYLADIPQSLRDMTRIAGSSPELWDDICITNRQNLIECVDALIRQLNGIRAALRRSDVRSLNRILAAAQRKRRRFL